MSLRLVPFTEKAVQSYLDSCIRYWRSKSMRYSSDEMYVFEASCYVDAFQSMRSSLFGELLTCDDEEDMKDGKL